MVYAIPFKNQQKVEPSAVHDNYVNCQETFRFRICWLPELRKYIPRYGEVWEDI